VDTFTRHRIILFLSTSFLVCMGCEDRSFDLSGLQKSMSGECTGPQEDRDVLAFTEPPEMEVRALAEWELSDAVMVCPDDQHLDFYLDLTQVLAEWTRVLVFSGFPEDLDFLDRELEYRGVDPDNLKFFDYPCESLWIRDYGPITVERADGRLTLVDTVYGTQMMSNEAFPSLLAETLGMPVYRAWMELQGGNFMTNGQGLCVTSPLFWKDHLSEDDAYVLQSFLGCQQVIELQRLPGEETGHVDMYAKFTGPDTVLVGQLDDDSPDAFALEVNAKLLGEVDLPDGSLLKVVRVPIPRMESITYHTSLNSLLLRDAVIVPVYDGNRKPDPAVLEAYRQALPDGTAIIPIDATPIIDLYGAVHCVTMGLKLPRSFWKPEVRL